MEEMTDKEKAFIWQQGNVYSKGLASREIQNAHEKGIDYMSTHELNDVGKRILELISKYGREATFKGAICHANEKMWRYVYRGEIIGKKPLEEKMNMKKQTIKLNESQLGERIKEAINELDWKTYANAARKRAMKDGKGGATNQRVRDLDHAASKALNDKYPSTQRGWKDAQIMTDYDDYNGHQQVGRYPSLGQNSDFCNTFYNDLDGNTDNNYERIQIPGERSQEMSDYFNGKYNYTPENGWHLNESQLRQIVKESVKKVLNEIGDTPQGRENIYRSMEKKGMVI